MSDRTCATDECERKRHARGLCASCYAKQYKAKRMHHRECAYCAAPFTTYQAETECCSNTCAQRHRFGWVNATGWSTSTELVHVPQVKPAKTIPPKRSRWFACKCGICGAAFIAEGFHATCSDECQSLHRRARGKFKVGAAVRLAIYERDRWTCQICLAPTSRTYIHGDPNSPTLDHIIPQSHTAVPDHGENNLRLAHALCNSLRGAQVDMQEALPRGMANL